MVKREYSYPSKSGLCNIHARSWLPDTPEQIKGVFQITHGMAEIGDRYADFAHYLTENGFAVYCNDHLGHGKSVKSDNDLGFFGSENGWDSFVEDARTLTQIAKNENQGKPFVFFGHSMGSFVAREYASRYADDSDISAYIFCGTSGNNPAAPLGIKLTQAIAKIKGERYRSKLIDKIAFGTYNNKIENNRTSFDWLTRDEEIVNYYIANNYCGFLFTVSGFKDMFTILNKVSQKEWYSSLSKSTPTLLVAGTADPVGNYGKGVEQVYNDIKNNGCNATLKLFDDARHEILNEINRADVYEYIYNWCCSVIK